MPAPPQFRDPNASYVEIVVQMHEIGASAASQAAIGAVYP